MLVATPISTHHALAKAALEAGKHVFVEKPMTADTAQARELVELAAERGLTLMVGHTFVFSPPVRKVKELIDAGELGDIYFITTQRVNLGLHQKDVSVIWDLAPHDLSILYYWLGEAAASRQRHRPRLHRPGHPRRGLHQPALPQRHRRRDPGAAGCHPSSCGAPSSSAARRCSSTTTPRTSRRSRSSTTAWTSRSPTDFGEFQLSYRTGDIVAPKISGTEPLWLEAEHFVHCVRSGEPPLTDGWAGLRVVASLEAAQASLDAGGGEFAPAPSGADACAPTP